MSLYSKFNNIPVFYVQYSIIEASYIHSPSIFQAVYLNHKTILNRDKYNTTISVISSPKNPVLHPEKQVEI